MTSPTRPAPGAGGATGRGGKRKDDKAMSELDAERFERDMNADLTDDDLEIINVEYTKGSLEVALAAGAKAERARIVALLEAARDDKLKVGRRFREAGMHYSANDMRHQTLLLEELLGKLAVRQ